MRRGEGRNSCVCRWPFLASSSPKSFPKLYTLFTLDSFPSPTTLQIPPFCYPPKSHIPRLSKRDHIPKVKFRIFCTSKTERKHLMGTPQHHHCQMLVGHSPQQPNADSFAALLEVPPYDAMELLLPSALVPRVEPYLHSLVKDEVIPDTDFSNPNLSQLQQSDALRGEAVVAGASRKRNEADQKGKGSAKKKKKDGQVLPYVHVRARRGQATDSHSLAERARREKINARMKLLQELVPGCNKISGKALVLDEIINHVQSLQQQVEVLSMKLAAVNSWIDFDVDSLIYSGLGAVMDGNFANMSMPTTEFQLDGISEMHYQQWPLDSIHQPILAKEESQSIFTPEVSPLSSNSSAN